MEKAARLTSETEKASLVHMGLDGATPDPRPT